jgi:hypothetical protein
MRRVELGKGPVELQKRRVVLREGRAALGDRLTEV